MSGTLQVYFFTVKINTRNKLKNVQEKKVGRMNEGGKGMNEKMEKIKGED
jgi:hypothetical protein